MPNCKTETPNLYAGSRVLQQCDHACPTCVGQALYPLLPGGHFCLGCDKVYIESQGAFVDAAPQWLLFRHPDGSPGLRFVGPP